MPTSRVRRPTQAPAVPADPRLLVLDLDLWAGHQVAHAGRDLALLGKVVALRLVAGGRSIEARVRDVGPHAHRVMVTASGEDPTAHCTCPYEEGPACKHAVAALEVLRFPRPIVKTAAGRRAKPRRAGRLARGQGRIVTQAPAQSGMLLAGPGDYALTQAERIEAARADEVQARRQRAKKERARVTRLPMRGGPPRFRVAGRASDGPYTVTLRARDAKLASCTCPDWAKSELGTCKHIERVRNWFARRPKRLPTDVASVWWKSREWPASPPEPLDEIRADAARPDVFAALRDFFDADGWITRSPEGVERAAWVRRAIDAARDASTAHGFHFDLDPAVDKLVEESERARGLTERLAGGRKSGEAWSEALAGLGFTLHAYQEDGAEFLATRGRAFLADDMGLGKTIQAIAASLILRRTAGARRALVVCPASLKHQWSQEILKACGEHALIVEGTGLERERAYRDWTGGFLVVNYELALRDLEALRRAAPELVILDEAQRIKNWDTKTAKAIKRLESPLAFVLTGTPLENRLTELHSLAEFLHPRALGPRWRLLPRHAVPGPSGRIAAYEDLDELRARLAPFFMRRERRDVLDQLPPRTDNTFWTEMTPAQRRPYRRHARKVATLLSQKRPLTAAEVRLLLQSLTSMRILCNAYAQYAWDYAEGHLDRPRDGDLRWIQSPKLEEFTRVLEDLLDDTPGRIVVFSQWERLLRLAAWASEPALAARGARSTIFHGGLDVRTRARVIDEFREDATFRVLFSTDSGGLGLNLQDAASIVVNLEVPWNPAILEQRIGRVHRLGQRESVQVLHFVTKGALEERIRQVVENKRALFEGLLVDDADRVELDEAVQATFVDRMRALLD
jgi:superfamily II DNA or RNA helicase